MAAAIESVFDSGRFQIIVKEQVGDRKSVV